MHNKYTYEDSLLLSSITKADVLQCRYVFLAYIDQAIYLPTEKV